MGDLKRYALVIGNSDYEHLEKLENPEKDYTNVGEKLKNSFGFQVTSAPNQTYMELNSLIDEFAEKHDSISDIVFYYSGHGCSIRGKNYIIPVDSPARLRPQTCVGLDYIIDSLVKLRHLDTIPIIVILDCCRSETTLQGVYQNSDFIKDEGKHTNIFIMYATGGGQIASDGENSNGAFTEILLTLMDTYEDIDNISKDVVTRLSNHPSCKNTQVPWISSSLSKPYFFRTTLKERNFRNFQPISLPSQERLFLPKYPENPRFIDRPDVFKDLERIVKENTDKNIFRPITLCGLGGMGKSQIALRFCYQNKDNYKYIFWMEADTETTLQNSFIDVARILNLPAIDYKNPETIVLQIITWFQNNEGWLLIFDNADDYSLESTSDTRRLQNKYFPKRGSGTIIITTRNNFADYEDSLINLNDMMMDDDTALKLLLRERVRLLSEVSSALKIIHLLGHLPLAIDLTGALMKMDNLTPTDFLKKYNEDPTGYLDLKDVQERIGSAYGKTVLTVWNISFNRIKDKNPLAADLLQSFAFLYPDNIPFALFSRHAQAILKLNNPLSERDLNAALHVLQVFSFVRKTILEDDITKVTLTIHRLVQNAILYKKKLDEQLEWYGRFISALSEEVPSEYQLNNEDSEKIMEIYIPHIQHIFKQFAISTSTQFNNPKELITLLSPTILYLIRQCLFEGVEYLAELCVSVSEIENGQLHPDTAAALIKLSQVHVIQSRFDLAEPYCLRSLKIRRKIYGPSHKDTISALHHLANIYSRLDKEKHATQIYWEAAITGDHDAQRTLATRYSQGIGAPVHKILSIYWSDRSIENNSLDKPIKLDNDTKSDLTIPLYDAIQQGDIDKIRSRITDYKQFSTFKDKNGKTPLHIAAENGNIEIMKLLLNEFGLDRDINIQDNHCQTPLHLASKNGHMAMVNFLITELKADVSIMTINEMTAMQLAAINGHCDIVKKFLREIGTTKLDLGGFQIGKDAIQAVAELLKKSIIITNLDLRDNGIGAEGVRVLTESLKNNTTITNLNLRCNGIGDEGIRVLAECLKNNTTIANLDLSDNYIGDEGARALAECLNNNTAITNLYLSRNCISGEGTRALAECLKNNTTITKLDLRESRISAKNSHILAQRLKQNASPNDLNHDNELKKNISNDLKYKEENLDSIVVMLYDTTINKSNSDILSQYSKENTSIMKLDFEYFELNPTNIGRIQILCQEPIAIELDLDGRLIGDSGAKILADFLKYNTTLTNLDLSCNDIGNEGTRALAEGLKNNTIIMNLNLGRNRIGDEGACALAESLKYKITLTNLDLSYNRIGIEGARSLAKGLWNNTTLTILKLRGNSIGFKGCLALAVFAPRIFWISIFSF